jgi:hypothetical protein
MADPDQWTTAPVLTACELALSSQPTLFCFVVERASEVLGKDSPEFNALMLRCAPPADVSVRERVREGYGWSGSRSELYRRSGLAAERVAAALNASGVAVPAALLRAGDS